MDLVVGARRVVVVMEHSSKSGEPKVLKQCKLPYTGRKAVNRIITDRAVFDVHPSSGLEMIELAPGESVEEVKKLTEPAFKVSASLREMKL